MVSYSDCFLVLLVACGLLNVAAEEGDKRAKAAATRHEALQGPEQFFSDNFYLRVTKGIVVHVFDQGNGSRPVDAILLERGAKSVKGSTIGSANKTVSEFSVSLDWKDQEFSGSKLKLQGIILKMTFQKKKKEWTLTKITADQMTLGNDNLRETEIKVKSKLGYIVTAPLGTAFDCSDVGMFMPAASAKKEHEKYKIGLSFPGMVLQVFDLKEPKFGPSWQCGEIFSIALWVGLIVTFFFALVCWWGFSMLANINTMDRFEDPKGKPIQVPQGE